MMRLAAGVSLRTATQFVVRRFLWRAPSPPHVIGAAPLLVERLTRAFSVEPKATPFTVVIKIGTSSITSADGTLKLGNMAKLVEECASLRSCGHRVVLVSSGAVGLGAQVMQFTQKPEALALKQVRGGGKGKADPAGRNL